MYERSVFYGITFGWMLFLFGCGGPKITPLSEPIFRLNSTQTPTGCKDAQDKSTPCRWDIKGAVEGLAVVSEGENPFRDCQSCKFNQKFSVKDGMGTIHFVYYKLPTEEVVPLTQGKEVNLVFIHADAFGQGFAMSLRDLAGKLLFAVASGPGGRYLTSDLLGQFTVQEDSEMVAGQESSECGTKLFRYLVFQSGNQTSRLKPGEKSILKDTVGVPFRIANVNRFNRQGGGQCTQLGDSPFSYFLFFEPAGN